MLEPQGRNTIRNSVRRPVLLGLFTGTAVGVGYLLAGVPNVELMSLVIALAGGVLGAASGALCGAVAMAIYSLGNPYGAAVPLLLVGQSAALAGVGVLGALATGPVRRALAGGRRPLAVALAAGCGLLGALVFDAVTNLAVLGTFELEPRVVLWGAVPFALIHGGVNALVFGSLFPVLQARLANLARSPLVGRFSGGAALLAVFLLCGAPSEAGAQRPARPADRPADAGADSTHASRPVPAPAPTDTTAAADEPVVPAGPNDWSRPLWQPFLGTLIEEMEHHSPFLPVIDGGLGAPALLLGATGTSTTPLFVRDGIPLGTGHSLTDDPWLVSGQGADPRYTAGGADGWGGTGGRVDLDRHDPDSTRAISHYAGRKGPHENYFRGVSLLTPSAGWRAKFDFEESLDNEGYNYTEEADEIFRQDEYYRGHAKIRMSHLALERRVDDDTRLAFHYHTGRKTRDSLPVWGAEHQEVWDVGIGVRAAGRSGAWKLDSAMFWNDRDVQWGDRSSFRSPGSELRLLETAREGASLTAARELPGGTLQLRGRLWNWEVHDTGAGWVETATGLSYQDLRGDGQQARAGAGYTWRAGPVMLSADADLDWDSDCEWAGDWALALAPNRDGDAEAAPAWRLSLAGDGRTPRSDERLTPVRREIGDRTIVLLPGTGLERERNLRAAISAGRRLLGVDLALDADWTRLRDGIGWVASSDDPDVGEWENVLDLDGSRVTVSAERGGSFLGWTSLRVEGTWRSFDQKSGTTPLLPEQWVRLRLGWENHFFSEDGIFQLALLSTLRGEMDDPWDVTGNSRLPSADRHDLIAGFRLVGAHLSLAWRNLLDERLQLSTGALSPGREMDMRLYWMFRH